MCRIYSKQLQSYVPVNVVARVYDLQSFGIYTKYIVRDDMTPVGYLDVLDRPNGIHVEYITNTNPNLYSGFGKIADQIEVEHCLKRGLNDFDIESEACLNSHALHYKRGKRFKNDKINELVKRIIDATKKGKKYETSFLGTVAMYMPKDLIKKYMEIIKNHPLLK